MQPGSSLNQSKQETLTLNFEEVKYGAQSRLCLYPSGAVHRYNSRACRLSVCALALFLSQTQACVSVSNLSTNGLHQILGEVHRPPRQGMRSSADSLDKKRFIGEQHRGELERRDGRGEERRAEQRSAAQRSAAHTAEQRHAHLAARPRRGIPARSAFCLNSDLHDLFLRETLHVSLFAPQWVW